MGQGIDLARPYAPHHAAALDDLKDQLLIVFLRRLLGDGPQPDHLTRALSMRRAKQRMTWNRAAAIAFRVGFARRLSRSQRKRGFGPMVALIRYGPSRPDGSIMPSRLARMAIIAMLFAAGPYRREDRGDNGPWRDVK